MHSMHEQSTLSVAFGKAISRGRPCGPMSNPNECFVGIRYNVLSIDGMFRWDSTGVSLAYSS